MGKHRSKFLKRIVTPYFIMLLIVLSAAMVFVYTVVTERIKSSALENGQQLATKTAQQTDAYLSDMDLIAQQVCNQTEIVNYFYMLDTEADSANKFDTDMLKSIELSSALKRVLVDRMATYNITIYNNYGDFISSRDYITDKRNLPELLTENDYDGKIRLIENNGGNLILPPAINKWTNERAPCITLMRELKNDYSDRPCGIIEVRCDISVFPGAIGADNAAGDNVVVTDNGSGDVIYPLDYSENFGEQKGYVTATVNMADWTVAMRVQEVVTGGVSLWLILIFVVGYLVLAAFMFVFASFIGRYITRPIAELTKYVKTVDTPDMQPKPVSGEAIDEIQELEDSFGKMMSRMNKSILQEKKAYSLALQAPQNPHFLYNSLSVRGAAGSAAGADEVYDMCIELSDMLRYVAAYEKVTVPLKEEL
ncbi:MAG: histidine kinase [Clostridia bacterium]|nr:histidine kinase [Clostridia bacterium]